MAVGRGLRGAGRPGPGVVDAGVAVLVFLTVLAPLLAGGRPDGQVRLEATLTSVGLLAAACAALAVRRRAPWSAWVATTVLGLAACAEAGGPTPTYLPAVLTLATLASRTTTARTALAATVSAFAPVVVITAVGSVGSAGSGQGLLDSVALGLAPWSAAAAMAGLAIRNQRAVVAGALERAAQAEARQEEEAQRRVAEERLRIARDLHDVVAHHVAVVNVQAGVAQHLLRSQPDRAAEALAHVREASATVLQEVPGLLGLLRTTEDEQPTAPTPTLHEAGALVEQSRRSGLDVTLSTTGAPAPLSVGADLAAYRVLQESLTNAARHGTGHVDVALHHSSDGCRLEVSNPLPARARAEASAAPRHGLVGMRERVAASGGALSVGPRGPHWVVEAAWPAEPGERAR